MIDCSPNSPVSPSSAFKSIDDVLAREMITGTSGTSTYDFPVVMNNVLGTKFKLGENRGRRIESELAPIVTATIHPSAILRQRDDESRHAERLAFTRDLEQIASVLNARS